MGFLNEKRCKICMIYKKDYNKVAIDTGKKRIMFMTDEKGNILKHTKND